MLFLSPCTVSLISLEKLLLLGELTKFVSFHFFLQSLVSPQSRLVITSSEEGSSSSGVLSADAISIEVPIDDVRVGDSILVLPGETIPVDVCYCD